MTLAPRPMCYRCFKPAPLCVCASIPLVRARTKITIIQHPRERLHPIGTVRFARLGLERVRVECVGPCEPRLADIVAALPADSALLFPSGDARDLSELAPTERPKNLVILDGTWSHAKALYRNSPELAKLPHYRLTPRRPSRYRIRKEPAAHCLSTIEAIVEALRLLEPDNTELDGLLTAFEAMVDRQIDMARQNHGRQRRRRQRRYAPSLLTQRRNDLVVVYAETLRKTGGDRQLLYLTAHRPATGESFGQLVKHPSTADRLDHLGISAAAYADAVPLCELTKRWRAFSRPKDVHVAWHASSLRVVESRQSSLLLKSVFCNLHRTAAGHLEDLPRRLGSAPIATSFLGRAGVRMGCSLAMLEHLQNVELSP